MRRRLPWRVRDDGQRPSCEAGRTHSGSDVFGRRTCPPGLAAIFLDFYRGTRICGSVPSAHLEQPRDVGHLVCGPSDRVASSRGRVARSPFTGGSTMARHLFFAITLIGTGVLLNSPAEAVTAARCGDQAANCIGSCANPSGGANQSRCMNSCDRQSTSCMIRAYDDARRWWR
jgi:hypothetical protein